MLTPCWGAVSRKAACFSPADSWAAMGHDGNILSLPASLTSDQQSPTFLASVTSFMEGNFPQTQGQGGWFQDDSRSFTFLMHFISNLMLPLI